MIVTLEVPASEAAESFKLHPLIGELLRVEVFQR